MLETIGAISVGLMFVILFMVLVRGSAELAIKTCDKLYGDYGILTNKWYYLSYWVCVLGYMSFGAILLGLLTKSLI